MAKVLTLTERERLSFFMNRYPLLGNGNGFRFFSLRRRYRRRSGEGRSHGDREEGPKWTKEAANDRSWFIHKIGYPIDSKASYKTTNGPLIINL